MKQSLQLAVVIPTRNRPKDLANLLSCLEDQEGLINQVVVVDSSDNDDSEKICRRSKLPLEYKHTDMKSAAIQRNIGMTRIDLKTTHLGFLDDDVKIEPDYFLQLVHELTEKNAIGISGIALNPLAFSLRTKPKGAVGKFYRLFLLDSLIDGKLLSSGVNVPVRDYEGCTVEVDWLIGCSVWNFQNVKDLRFEEDFFGQSLGEDVIFSYLASKRGILLTNPNVLITHYESAVGRPGNVEFYRMWTRNRYRLIQTMDLGFRGRASYVWSNLGQSIILFYQLFRRSISELKPILIIAFETFRMFFTRGI